MIKMDSYIRVKRKLNVDMAHVVECLDGLSNLVSSVQGT